MNFAINLKSVVCKLWFALLAAALVSVSLMDHAKAQTPKAKVKSQKALQEASHTSELKTPVLALDEYLDQVRKGNDSFKGAELATEGATLHSSEYKLLTMPTLIGDFGYSDNRTETGSPLLGDINRTQHYNLGVHELTPFGLDASLIYSLNQTSLPQASAQFINPNSFWQAGPVLQLTQSLWRNGFGSGTRAQQEQISAQALATKYKNSFQQKQLLSQAETTYWRLALAREAVDLAKENLDLAERLRGWSSGRQRSGLGDKSDYLQSSTAYLARQLELKSAVDEEKSASRAFNTVRGIDSDLVSETLPAFTSDVIDKRMRSPERADTPDDVRLAEQQMRLAEAQAKVSAEKDRPAVDVYGTVGYSGRDFERAEATHESMTTSHPNYGVGLKIEVPLDVGAASDAVKGYKAEARAAQLTYNQTKFESDRSWKDLSQALQDSLARYKLASQIEQAQREKMEYERVRHGRGRTTTFQVIQFEADYAAAQLARIRTQGEILNQYAKLKLFAGGSQ